MINHAQPQIVYGFYSVFNGFFFLASGLTQVQKSIPVKVVAQKRKTRLKLFVGYSYYTYVILPPNS